jgi:hypothetical protein
MGFVGALWRLFKRKVVTSRGKLRLVCYEINSKKRRANHLHPLSDGSEKDEGFPHRARETMTARYKRWQLGVVGWRA